MKKKRAGLLRPQLLTVDPRLLPAYGHVADTIFTAVIFM
jgi:hypothetical protein